MYHGGNKMSNNPFEKISRIGDSVSSAISTIQSKKELIVKQVINGILLFIILLVFGCLDFATLKFHPEYILELSYWATVFSKTVAGVCAFNIGINLMWDTEIKKDLILEENIILYNKLRVYKQNDFEYFVTQIYNPREKEKAYISQINRKIYLLNRVSRRKDRLLYSKEIPQDAENREELVKKLEEERKVNKYCIIRKELEDLKDPEYIKKNLDSLEVKYYEVDATVFDLEIDGAAAIHGTKTRGNITIGKVKASTNVVIGMIGFSMFITSIGLELNAEQFADQMEAFWHYLLKCATDVGIVLWQTMRGMLKTRRIISDELTQPYVGRNKVLTDYLEWRLKTNQPDSLSYKELHKDDDAEVIEISEEKLKELVDNK